MFYILKKKKTHPAYISKHNSNCEKQAILLMIPNVKHCPAIKKLSALLRGITSKHYGDFYCLNCLDLFRRKNKLEAHKKVCKNKDFCNVIMPLKILKYQNLIKIKNFKNHHLLFIKIFNV